MPRSVLALVGGLLTFVLITRAGSSLATAAFGVTSADAQTGQLALTLLVGAVAGIPAGYVAAMVGRSAPLPHALCAAVVLAALSFYVLPRPTDSRQPRWFPYALTAVGSAAILAGGALRASHSARSGVG